MAYPSLHFEAVDIVVTSCRSILCKNLQSNGNGMLLRAGEHLLVTSDGNEHQVIQALQYFCLCHCNQYYNFVKGELYIWPDDKPIHPYSGNQVVYPSSQVLLVPANKILRKVMLCPDPDNIMSPTCYVVLDYYRTVLPCSAQDIIVPVYPEINDMVQVCGSSDEIWLGHVRSVDTMNKACHVNFCIEDSTCSGRFKQEYFGRLSTNIVQWESIVRICHGHWSSNGRFWYHT